MLVALLLVAVTVGIVAVEPAPQTLWRHLYLAPVVIAGVRYGGPAAVVTALASVLLFGPIVLREIERAGAIPAVCDALVTFVILLLAGALTGALAARARRQRCRYEAVLAAQRLAAEPAPLGIVLVKLRAVLQPRLDAAAVGLVIVDGDEPVVSGGARLALDSVAARVIAGGEPRFVPDTGGNPGHAGRWSSRSPPGAEQSARSRSSGTAISRARSGTPSPDSARRSASHSTTHGWPPASAGSPTSSSGRSARRRRGWPRWIV